ncbi:MAG: methylenetetrahydrofolate reductase [NAD(P)H] [Gammaproteobacteria bacterium]|nr:methylenetetrahydrofolate reductase [NAD(P)H] [Gammaproteobacteria bacterium]
MAAKITPSVSFEFFPPSNDEMDSMLWQSLGKLSNLKPQFVSVTYGADGSTQKRTYSVVSKIINETNLTPAPHLTCVNATRDEINEIARRYWDMGIRHLVALRGDAPKECKSYIPHPKGYAYASDLVAGLIKVADFDISVAAYPEVHPEAKDALFDLDNLKRKLDAGASNAITQFFFDSDKFLRFRDLCGQAGIESAIIPGILPITRFSQMERFAKICGTKIPKDLRLQFKGLDEDSKIHQTIATNAAVAQVKYLESEGIKDFHFYTLNRSEITFAICNALGLKKLS